MVGQWVLKCPTGGEYESLCTHKGRDVSCWIVRSLKSAPGGCIDLEKLRGSRLHELEEDYAHKVLGLLSEKYGIRKPDLVILDECPSKSPESYGIYKASGEKKEIGVCRGGVNAHVISHEFAHNLQVESGKPLSEHGAEQIAKKEMTRERTYKFELRDLQKGLISEVSTGKDIDEAARRLGKKLGYDEDIVVIIESTSIWNPVKKTWIPNRPWYEEEKTPYEWETAGHSDQKPLNVDAAHNRVGDGMPTTWREVGVIYGGQHIAKGLERGFVEVDRYMNRSASPVQERPSTWLNMGLGVGLPLVAMYGKVRSPYNALMVLMGGHFSTKLWDYGEEVLTGVGGGGAARVVYVPAAAAATPGAVSIPGGGRYVVTG
jgi:hypothetical protein